MNKDLEEKIRTYRQLTIAEDMSPTEKAYKAKQKRDLWWEIRQSSKEFPRALRQRIYRDAHPERVIEQWIRQRDKIRNLKIEVLTHYGNGKLACVKCGSSDVRALSIDHIEGRGNRHRQGKLRTSASFYTWLKAKEYPTGYQTLCMNCQFIKRDENNEQGRYAFEPIDWGTL